MKITATNKFRSLSSQLVVRAVPALHASRTCLKSVLKTNLSKPKLLLLKSKYFFVVAITPFHLIVVLIVQTRRYVMNPILLDGFKISFRIYVAITSISPLRIYVHPSGLTRISSEK
jgi:hypothetical protein